MSSPPGIPADIPAGVPASATGPGGPARTGATAPVLAGTTVLVTADRRSAELGSALERRGAAVRHAPSLSIVPHVDDAALLAATRSLLADPPDVVVATTGIGFRSWVEAADAAGFAAELLEVLAGARLVARGPKARGAIQQAGLAADWVAESETSAEVGEWLLTEGVDGLHVAVQHHGAGSDGLDEMLEEAGARVTSLVVYRWGPPKDPQALRASTVAVAGGEVDALVFTSAPGAHAWVEAAREAGVLPGVLRATQELGVVAAAVGPVTARPLEAAGITPLVPDRGRLGSLVRTVVTHFAERDAADGLDTVAGRLVVHRTAATLDHRVLPLSPSGLAVLRLLAAARGGVVPRADLLSALPGGSDDAHAAEVAVARLREAVGSRDLVRTVVKRGYRLGLAEDGGAS